MTRSILDREKDARDPAAVRRRRERIVEDDGFRASSNRQGKRKEDARTHGAHRNTVASGLPQIRPLSDESSKLGEFQPFARAVVIRLTGEADHSLLTPARSGTPRSVLLCAWGCTSATTSDLVVAHGFARPLTLRRRSFVGDTRQI